jgi:hypothetical protein
VVFWDMGGLHEYRLLHRGFLHDTMIALMVMEPRRGQVALRELDAWDRQLATERSKIKRTLVKSELDDDSVPRDPVLVESALSAQRCVSYAETSARNGIGIVALRRRRQSRRDRLRIGHGDDAPAAVPAYPLLHELLVAGRVPAVPRVVDTAVAPELLGLMARRLVRIARREISARMRGRRTG